MLNTQNTTLFQLNIHCSQKSLISVLQRMWVFKLLTTEIVPKISLNLNIVAH